MKKPAKKSNITKSITNKKSKLLLISGVLILFITLSIVMAFTNGTGPLAYFANSIAINAVSAKKCQEDPACADLVSEAQRAGIVISDSAKAGTSNRVVKEVENTVKLVKERVNNESEINDSSPNSPVTPASQMLSTINNTNLPSALETAKVQVENDINKNLLFYKRNNLNNPRQLNCSDGNMRHPLGTTINNSSGGCDTCIVRRSKDGNSVMPQFTPSRCTNDKVSNKTPKCYLFQATDQSNLNQSPRYTTKEGLSNYPNRVAYPTGKTKYVVKLDGVNRLIKCVDHKGVGDWDFIK